MAEDLDYLLLMLKSNRLQDRKKAVAAIEKSGILQAAPNLIELFSSERDESIKALAARALGSLNCRDAMGVLLNALSAGSDELAYYASNAISQIRPKGVEDEIYGMMMADNVSERSFYWFAQTLFGLGCDGAFRLIDALATNSWTKRRILGDLLPKSGPACIVYLISGLSDDNVNKRFWCATILGKIGAKEAVGELVSHIDDSSDDVRTAVITSLGEIGSKEAIDVLKQNLKSPIKEVRYRSLEVLGRFGDEIIDSLVESLSDDYWYVRDCACQALARIGKKVVPRLAVAYESQNEDIRISAIKALSEMGFDAFDVLAKALADEYEPVCKKAAEALAKIGFKCFKKLVTLYESDSSDAKIRRWIIYILGEMNRTEEKSEATSLLLEAVASKELMTRYAAVSALKNSGRARAVNVLIELLADIHEEIREKASENLIYMANASLPFLIDALNHENWVVRKNVSAVLGKFGIMAIPELLKVLHAGDDDSRYWAIKALGNIGADACEPLLQFLNDASWQVRKNSADSLSEIGIAVVKPLIAQLVKKVPGPEENLFYWSKYVLKAIGSPAVPAVAKLMQNSRTQLRMLAVSVIGSCYKDPETYQYIKDALNDENIEVVKQAIECAGSYGDVKIIDELLAIYEKVPDDDGLTVSLIKSLSSLESEKSLVFLYKNLKAGRWIIRNKAVLAFENLPDKTRSLVDIDKVAALLDDEVTMVAESAARFLASLKSEKAQIIVVRLLKEGRFEDIILDRLSSNGDFKSKDLLERYLKSDNKFRRAAAARVLGACGNKSDIGYLTSLLTDEFINVRMSALHAINRINNCDADFSNSNDECSATISASDDSIMSGAEQHYQLGMFHAKNLEYEKAIQAYQNAISIEPDFVQAYCKIGLILEEKGLYEKAGMVFRKATEIAPDFVPAKLYLGVALSMCGRHFDAVGELSKAIKLDPRSETAAMAQKIIDKIKKNMN